jgi:hypothetical protein
VLRAFFQEDRDIVQTEVLVDIAADVGLNAEKAEEVLASIQRRFYHTVSPPVIIVLQARTAVIQWESGIDIATPRNGRSNKHDIEQYRLFVCDKSDWFYGK